MRYTINSWDPNDDDPWYCYLPGVCWGGGTRPRDGPIKPPPAPIEPDPDDPDDHHMDPVPRDDPWINPNDPYFILKTGLRSRQYKLFRSRRRRYHKRYKRVYRKPHSRWNRRKFYKKKRR